MASDEDDDKTRVLPRKPAAGRPKGRDGTGKAAAGPQIEFRCPQGHAIKAPAALAGKRGKCPMCRAPVTIPATSQPSSEQAAAEPASPPAAAEPPMGFPPPPPELPPQEPSPGPAAATEQAADESAQSSAGETADELENWDFIAAQADAPPAEAFTTGGFDGGGWSAGSAVDFGSEEQNPTAMLVARLWAERDHGGIIELHLAGGSVILPEWYDATWSRGTHGLFASQAADGSVTLTAVAWETVQKVVVRQLSEVPEDMFT